MITKDEAYVLTVNALREVESVLDLYCNNSGVDPSVVLPLVRRALVATELVPETRIERNDRQITAAFAELRVELSSRQRRQLAADREASADLGRVVGTPEAEAARDKAKAGVNLSVVCPTCDAPIGEVCNWRVTHSGGSVHAPRRKLVAKATADKRAAESLRREAASSYCGDVHGEE